MPHTAPAIREPRAVLFGGGVLAALIVMCITPAAAATGENARDAGAGCPVGWGGGLGKGGEEEIPTCQSVRRSFPSVQSGEVIVAPSRVSPLVSLCVWVGVIMRCDWVMCVFVCLCVCVYVCICVCLYVCLRVCVGVCACVCIYERESKREFAGEGVR